mmetsp:Transcript_14351/g.40562  ORF Transcript_14351/g.40562 Transcript_14351/m.40562 type:complete len:291 (+) Transcript_14351:170-1042(+)|eukprot:CAMPEP_0117666500 /NCGR_PEP_ID=MMETSP0804-20121206/10413_1 /TAXON_ID=1074897 /ORGANISM="Tetraselmis astigmatica, Strain CCMP880" /LENGTH=290 /DNA_ID=CAMNT_0005474057 /DNA_START=123 /DNA_END=995 /DNA_ORIENTATION=-
MCTMFCASAASIRSVGDPSCSSRAFQPSSSRSCVSPPNRGTASLFKPLCRFKHFRSNTCVAFHVHSSAVAFPAEAPGHSEFYQQPSPLQALNIKKARKLAKKIQKEKKSLTKIAELQLVSRVILKDVTSELDKAYALVCERVEQLEAAAGVGSSSSGEEICASPSVSDETDSALIAQKLEGKKCETATMGFARVCAATVEDPPPVSGRIFVCGGKACCRKGADGVLKKVQAAAVSVGGGITVTPTGCLGKCKQGAAIRVKAGAGKADLVTRVSDSHVDDIFEYMFDVRPH